MKINNHDIVVFGATSFVGELICQYMVQHFHADELSWALAGRSEKKLNELKRSLGEGGQNIPIIIADVDDFDSLTAMCNQARVVMSTVGPYDLYGEALIRACVESGTDYCDLTGEPHWIKKMLDLYEADAKKSGARIVHCTGFDSIPSDVGVYHIQREAKKRFGAPCNKVSMRIKNMRGGASGGTAATAINIAKEIKQNTEVRRDLANPYSLTSGYRGFTARQNEIKVEYDENFDTWVGPFFMSSINTRIVHRSNALSNGAYGDNFLYDEGVMTGKGVKGKNRARAIYWGLALFFAGAGFNVVRKLLTNFVLPKPGEGPSEKEQREGFYDFRFIGKTEKGEIITTKVYGDMDPGYGSTAKIIGQAAYCLAFEVQSDIGGGFWTPASIMGDVLIDRLTSHSGLTFEVLEE